MFLILNITYLKDSHNIIYVLLQDFTDYSQNYPDLNSISLQVTVACYLCTKMAVHF